MMTTSGKYIILVEDDEATREGYAEILRDAGFHIDTFSNRETVLAACKHIVPDLVILDISLHSERDAGFEICKELRLMMPTLPIIFLTAHDSDIDRISGLRLGADDYLVKTVSLDYLIVRIETLLRRTQILLNLSQENISIEPRYEQSITLGNLELQSNQLQVFWLRQSVDLNLTQFWIVKALIEHPGQLKTFLDLMNAANIVVENNTIISHIKHIRERFRRIDNRFDCIKNERGRGYRWIIE